MEDLISILESGTSEEKIKILQSLAYTNNSEFIKKMINCLDDSDIKVRGEAFSSLILNTNEISHFLMQSLKDSRKNVRGFVSLVLANRNDSNAIPKIIELLDDERSMVRSCALGSLGYLKAQEAKNKIHDCILDSNLEVRKSALQAMIELQDEISEKEFLQISKEKDSELDNLIVKLKKSGPEGI